MDIRAVIFDLDGVLVFTDQYHFRAWKQLADELRIPFDKEINHGLRGVSRMKSLEIILEAYQGIPFSEEEKVVLAERKNNIYKSLLKQMDSSDVSIEVKRTLIELKRRGYRVAIGSSSKNAGFILQKVNILDFFEAVSDGNNISKSKPNPEVFLKAAAYLGELPEHCLVVEDAEAGIEAGIAGKMKTAAIGNAIKCKKADYELETIEDLLKYLR